MKELKILICEMLGITEEEYDAFVAKHGYDCDLMLLSQAPPRDNIDGLKKILEDSNPCYGVQR